MDRWRVVRVMQQRLLDTTDSAISRGYLESLVHYFRGWRYPFFGTILLYLLMVLGWIGLGGGLADLGAQSLRHVAAGAFAATLLLFGIFLLNDAADRHVDARVHPDRPIPMGLSAWQHIWGTAVALLLAACAVSVFVNPASLAVAASMTAYAIAFYGWAKGGLDVPGSSEVLTPVVSALFPAYGLAVAGCTDPALFAGVVGYIYLADFSQDLLGGIHDQAGDRAGNVRTFALAIGERWTLVVSVVCFALATACGASLVVGGPLGLVYAATLSGVTAAMLPLYVGLFRATHADLLRKADRANHLAGMFYFVVSAAIFVDHVARRALPR